ncbi:MAG TPA: DUF4912 domain-containing protein [Verrucomicrobiae bacterium]|nr:DUF4912 domain-containing protein [Verrucomicrobiae bacterium]
MKKKPVSAPVTQKTAAAKPKRATPQPLLKRAVNAAKKMLQPKGGKGAAETEVDATTVVRRTYLKNKKTEDKSEIPAILLEGDAPAPVSASGPGEKYSLGATPPAQKFSGGELPEAYGTKKLFLTARDPHWLYAHWDLTREQQLELNGASTDGHLVLRIYAHKIEGHPLYEIHVHPESRHWFAHVERAGNSYAAELGYYSALGKWMRVAISSGTVTPPDAASKEDTAEFATIPFEIPFAKLIQIIEDAVRDNIPLAQAIEELRRHGHPDLPRLTPGAVATFNSATVPPSSTQPGASAPRAWTPQQEQALAKIINIDQSRRIWMGSLEITELIRRRLSQDVTSPTTSFGNSSFGLTSPTSPFGGGGAVGEQPKGFWFNLNAELIIYGATEPNAKVTLGGHEIKLRSDGTFSYRFALPDGKYDLPAVAVSASGDDARAADLKFVRDTQYLGDVGATPQDPSLKTPLPENV